MSRDTSYYSCELDSLNEDYVIVSSSENSILLKMYEEYQLTKNKEFKEFEIDEEFILNSHKEMACYHSTDAGTYRDVNIHIKGSSRSFPSYEKVREMMKNVLNQIRLLLNESSSIQNLIHVAAFIHYEMVNIHPFKVYNERMAIFIMNVILFKYCNIPPISILPGIRKEYLAALNEIDKRAYYSFLETIIQESIFRTLEKSNNLRDTSGGLSKVFHGVDMTLLSEYINKNRIIIDKNEVERSTIVDEIMEKARIDGEKALILELEKSDLEMILSERSNSLDLRSKLIRLIDRYSTMKRFLRTLSSCQLDILLTSLRMKSVDETIPEKITAILEEIEILGLKLGLSKLTHETLIKIGNSLKLPKLDGTKMEIIYEIIGSVHSHYTIHQDLLFKGDIMTITKEYTIEELYQFWFVELFEYCVNHNLATSQRKKNLCKTILKHLQQTSLNKY